MTRIGDLLDCDFSRPVDEIVKVDNHDIREVVARRVLRKKASQEPILRNLFRERGATLIQNVSLERCSRRTDFDENQFVRFYPYTPHWIDLSVDIMAGIRRHPGAQDLDAGNPTIVRQAFEMLMSDRTRFADQPIGALVSIDRIYDLLEENIPTEKRKAVNDIRQRFDNHEDYPGMPARVAKAICLMEFVGTDLPRTTNNIAALLIQRVTEAPPTLAVGEILHVMKVARFVRETNDGWKFYDLDELRRALAALEGHKNAVGIVNPRHPGWRNDLIQLVKRLLARSMAWYTRPVQEFNASVSKSLEEVLSALDHLSTNMVTRDDLSRNMAALDHLPMDLVALERRINTSPANCRTTYLIGLFGTGRRYLNELILQNIGERSKYFRDTIRLHPGPTPMIYSGHATIRHDCRLQYPPAITSRILDAVGSGFADLIFIYRHPLDSLLTNWVWWRTWIRENRSISGISQLYKNTDELAADLDRNFSDFEAFAEGDPDFFAGVPGPRFLSFQEFVEETDLHVQSGALTLRLEDFMIDPFKEFSKIAQAMSINLDLTRLSVAAPRTGPYGYLAVKDRVPRFRGFIGGLDMETRRRIEKVGYNIGI